MKVLHIRSTSGNYGAEKVILNVLPELRAMGCEIEVFILESPNSQGLVFGDEMEKLSIPMTRVKPSGKWDKKVYATLFELLQEGGFDVIHTHDYKSLFYAKSISRKLSIPLLHHMHGLLGNTVNEIIYAIVEKVMMRNIAKIFVVSKVMERALQKNYFIKSPIVFCRNGIDITSVEPKPKIKAVKRILLVARFTAEKNHRFAIDIIEKLISMGVRVELDFVGEGELEDEIKNHVKNLNLVNVVKFHGYQNELSHFYTGSDVLLITSLTEGLPMVLLEALSRALPVVSTPVGEIPSMLDEGECGEIISFDVDVAARKLNELLLDDAILNVMGNNGLKMVKNNYSIDRQAKDFSRAYEEIKLSHIESK